MLKVEFYVEPNDGNLVWVFIEMCNVYFVGQAVHGCFVEPQLLNEEEYHKLRKELEERTKGE